MTSPCYKGPAGKGWWPKILEAEPSSPAKRSVRMHTQLPGDLPETGESWVMSVDQPVSEAYGQSDHQSRDDEPPASKQRSASEPAKSDKGYLKGRTLVAALCCVTLA